MQKMLYEGGGERASAVAPGEVSRLMSELILNLARLGHRQRACVVHVGGVGTAIENDHEKEVRLLWHLRCGRKQSSAGQDQRAGAGKADLQDVAAGRGHGPVTGAAGNMGSW